MGCEQCKQPGSANHTEDLGDTSAKSVTAVPQEEQEISNGQVPLKGNTEDFLSRVELFKSLPLAELPKVASRCTQEQWKKGETIVNQGENSNALFVVQKGLCKLFANGNEVQGGLTAGDYFGEGSLLRGEESTATIVADTPVTALKITRHLFEQLGLLDKIEFPDRNAVAGGAGRKVATKPPSPKTPEETKKIKEALRSNQNLQTFSGGGANLVDGLLQKMVDVAWKENVKAGTTVIREGDLDADYFYIVQDGAFEVSSTNSPADGATSAEKLVSLRLTSPSDLGLLTPGQSFGELALLYFAPRAATVKAQVDSVVWVIDRNNFKDILLSVDTDVALKYIKYLDQLEACQGIGPEGKLQVARGLLEVSFEKDEVIFEQGDEGDTFYILTEGEISLIRNGKEAKRLKASPERAEYFGERALIKNEPRKATIKVISETAKALYLDKESFGLILRDNEAVGRTPSTGWGAQYSRPWEDASSLLSAAGVASVNVMTDEPKVRMKDLNKLGTLGTGGFGLVELVEHKHTKKTYALKTVSKGFIVKCGMQKGIMQEKLIQFMMSGSPFIIKLFDTYNGEQSLFFLLEAALGGELYRTYKKKKFHGSEDHARFYSAGVIFALEALHQKKVMYRDLKPENVMLSEAGLPKLTDMGLAKVCPGKTHTTCGTPEYFAPEVIWATGYTYAADWWTLGVFIFELMAGKTPFEAPQPMAIYSNVFKGIKAVTFPETMHQDCQDIVKSLCVQAASQRLPMKKGGTKLLKDHRFFEDFEWDAMEKQTLEPPYKPEVASQKDMANFLRDKPHKMPKQITYKDDGSGWDAEFATSM